MESPATVATRAFQVSVATPVLVDGQGTRASVGYQGTRVLVEFLDTVEVV